MTGCGVSVRGTLGNSLEVCVPGSTGQLLICGQEREWSAPVYLCSMRAEHADTAKIALQAADDVQLNQL